MDMLFESEKQKEATERLLASVRVRTINSEIGAYLNEMLGYAKEIDSILEKNSLGARYLDRVSMIDKVDSVYLDEVDQHTSQPSFLGRSRLWYFGGWRDSHDGNDIKEKGKASRGEVGGRLYHQKNDRGGKAYFLLDLDYHYCLSASFCL